MSEICLLSQGPVACVVVGSVMPVAVLGTGMLTYAFRWMRTGPYIDPEVETRSTSPLLGLSLRRMVAWMMLPLWRVVRATALPPDALTALSVLVSLGAAVAVASGSFAIGGWMFLFAGLFDMLDGQVARATGKATSRGAAFDSVLDRVSDAALLVGLAWHYQSSWVLFPVLVALVSSQLVSYVRARGEGLGVSIRGGWLARPERVVILGLSVALSPAVTAFAERGVDAPLYHLAIGGILIVAVGGVGTALLRFKRLLAALAALDEERVVVQGVLSRGSAVRSMLAAAIATVVDMMSVLFFVSTGVVPWAATILGTIVGALVNFIVGRLWAFGGHHSAARPQMSRYAVTWSVSSVLNAGGVFLLSLLPGIDYRVAWLITRALVFFGWNHPMQRDYVFASPEERPSL